MRLPESSARSNDPEFEKEYRSYLMSWKNSSENFHAIQKSSRFSKQNQRRSITSPGPAIACVWEKTEKALPSAPRSQTACFWKTTAALDAPNFYAYTIQGPVVSPENAVRFNPPTASWSLVIGMRPKSRGAIHLTGSDPADSVRIEANYLGEPEDLKDLIAGVRMAREIGNSDPLRPYTGREVVPGSLNAAEPEHFFRDGLATFWHQIWHRKNGP